MRADSTPKPQMFKSGRRTHTLSPCAFDRRNGPFKLLREKEKNWCGHVKSNYVKLEVSSASVSRCIIFCMGEGGLLHHRAAALHAARRSCAHDFFWCDYGKLHGENEAIALGDTQHTPPTKQKHNFYMQLCNGIGLIQG